MAPTLLQHPAASGTPEAEQMRAPAFGKAVHSDGTTVLPAAAVREHDASSPAPGPARRRLHAAMSGARPTGAFVLRDGTLTWHPALDVTKLVTTAEWVLGAIVVADRLMRRPSGARADVTMGPGGWVSMKGGAMAVRPARRLWRKQGLAAPAGRRPLWARLLAAKTLQSLIS